MRGSVAHEASSAVEWTAVHGHGAISALGPEAVAEASAGLRVYVGTRWSRAAPLERLVRLLRLALSGASWLR